LNRALDRTMLGAVSTATRPVGDQLREWRQRRRMSQLDLALEAEISTRHLSYVETGRSAPSREMVLHLAEQLGVPPRERNVLLVAAGYAPIFAERTLDDPALAIARQAIALVLDAQKPFPAFALDRHWNLAMSNQALPELYEGVAPALLAPPPNALRLSLHPEGLSSRIENLAEWRAHLLAHLAQQIDLTADPVLIALMDEVRAYPAGRAARPAPAVPANAVLIPLVIRIGAGRLSFFTTTTVFGTPLDVTLSELAIESFFPADEATEKLVRELGGG
jgi:transcriptional regulator with XRE-family HTH domain